MNKIAIKDRLDIINEVLTKEKDSIITYAVENFEEYSPEWLTDYVIDLYRDETGDLPQDTRVKDVLPIIESWYDEIADEIALSLEPTAREEAMADIREETIRSLRNGTA